MMEAWFSASETIASWSLNKVQMPPLSKAAAPVWSSVPENWKLLFQLFIWMSCVPPWTGRCLKPYPLCRYASSRPPSLRGWTDNPGNYWRKKLWLFSTFFTRNRYLPSISSLQCLSITFCFIKEPLWRIIFQLRCIRIWSVSHSYANFLSSPNHRAFKD